MNAYAICLTLFLTADPQITDLPVALPQPFQLATTVRGQNADYPYALAGNTVPYGGTATSPNGLPVSNSVFGGLFEPVQIPPMFQAPCNQAPAYRVFRLFGDFTYLAPRGVDLTYATPRTTVLGVNVLSGVAGVADPGYEPGFRVGGAWALGPTSNVTATYSYYRSDVNDSITATAPAFLQSEVAPASLATFLVTAAGGTSNARYQTDFDTVDLNYETIFYQGDNYQWRYALGVRYNRLEQQFHNEYTSSPSPPGGATTVDTSIDFDGVGPRIGLNGERTLGWGFSLYGDGAANFLLGHFQADYAFAAPAPVAMTTGFDDDRIVSQLDFELGLEWQDPYGVFNFRVGYYVGAWFNTLTTPAFIDAVKAANFTNVDDTLTFDGLTVRAEVRF